MIYNYTRCESVIAKIMADLDISEKNIRITDIREWIFEAVDKIGAPMQYVQKESGVDGEPIFEICDYQIPIPNGLQVLDGAAYSENKHGRYIPMRSNTSLFKGNMDYKCHACCGHNHHHHHNHINPNDHMKMPCIADNNYYHNQFCGDHHCCDHHEHWHYNNYKPDCHEHCHHDGCGDHHSHHLMPEKLHCTADLYHINGVRYAQRSANQYVGDDPTYFIKPGWIVTNKKHGFVKLAYKTIATDERGYPLIPDLSSYQEAVYWYVTMKLSFPKYLAGKLGGKGVNTAQNTYFYIQQQWNFYRNQAYAECMMPTAADMESIKNDWHKLIPDWDADETFFKHQGTEQINYNDYYYGY